jgi:hypothetical protein
MWTGEPIFGRAFDGETVTDVLAAVVTKEPDWSAVTGLVTRLLKKCLQKDRRQRLRDIGDAWDLLETETSTHGRPSRDVESTTRGRVTLALAVVGLVAAAAVAVIRVREVAPEPASPIRFQIQAALEAGANTPAMSPDGRHLVYQTSQGVIVRDLDSVDERLVATTDTPVGSPFWSADSRSIGYATSTKLMRVSVSGGPPQPICDVSGLVVVGVWLAGDRILFTQGQRVLEVSAAGGVASVVVGAPPGFLLGGAPQVLPDGQRFVYVVRLGTPEERGVFVGRLDGATKPVRLLSDETPVALVRTPGAPGGDLLFVRGGSLVGQPFDSNLAELSGAPSVIATNVQNFTASANGTVAYTGAAGQRHLTWFDRQGRATGTAWVPAEYNELNLSPDASRVAVVRPSNDGNTPATWIYDFSREASIQLLRTGVGIKPVWASDGKSLFVVQPGRSSSAEAYTLLRVTPGRDANEALAQSTTLKYPSSSSNDGRWLMYTDVDPKTKDDLWVLPLNGGQAGKPEPFLVSDYSETDGAFSPDGRRVAYVSDESGEREVYVRSFPAGTAGKWTISSGGGYQPRWNANGRELFYVTSKGELMSVDVTTPGGAFSASSPRRLFSMPIYGGGSSINNRYWDVTPDGQRFLVTTTGESSGTSTVTVVLNWQEELTQRMLTR